MLLSQSESRILGCLLEKERTTPENYPLSLNALVAACNQTTNRDPVTAYDDAAIEAGISALREKKLVTVVFGSGNRVQKYRHNLLDHFNLDPRDIAILCVLLLRGPQTGGELRSRTERLFHFATIEDLETSLDSLARGDSPLIKLLPQQPGQKERRYIQLFTPEPEPAPYSAPVHTPLRDDPALPTLREELATLRAEVADLKSQFADFKKQFE